MKILVVGSGGREHALCWRIRADRPDATLYCAPGNGGIGEIATLVPIKAEDVDGLAGWAGEQRPDLVVVGPEQPLAGGLVDSLRTDDVRVFGPAQTAARIETSKAWAAELVLANGIPAPDQAVFDDAAAARAYIGSAGGTVVVKADGLAAGKGALVCDSVEDAHRAVDEIMLARAFGAAGDRVVIQERLSGPELSVLAICDGSDFRVVGAARDYKRAHDGDQGLNTGGMGCYTPVADATPSLLERVSREIFAPALAGMQALGCPYTGVLYAGLVLTDSGPKVIEFNCRFGDPEAEVILPTLDGDLVSALEAAVDGRLDAARLTPSDDAAVCVMVASGGYPVRYDTGYPIAGLDAVSEDALLFHAGTARRGDQLVTSGGRVLAVVGRGPRLPVARQRAYAAAEAVTFDGAFFRTDIAADEALRRVESTRQDVGKTAPSPQPSPPEGGEGDGGIPPSPQPSPLGRGSDAAGKR